MKHLFGPTGRAALLSLAQGRPLLAFDFDGTLCPLHDRPGPSRTLPRNRVLLRKLGRSATIAVISGRSVRDLRPRLYFEPDFVIGNHGIEGLDRRGADRATAMVRAWRKQLAESGIFNADDPGLFIEDKTFSLSLHFRLARDPARAARRLRRLIARLTPEPRVVGGKFILNLVAPGAAHKGTALETLLRRTRARHALFVGDDVTDEDGFRVDRPGLVTVRVDRSRSSAAGHYVRGLDGVTELLERLSARAPFSK